MYGVVSGSICNRILAVHEIARLREGTDGHVSCVSRPITASMGLLQ